MGGWVGWVETGCPCQQTGTQAAARRSRKSLSRKRRAQASAGSPPHQAEAPLVAGRRAAAPMRAPAAARRLRVGGAGLGGQGRRQQALNGAAALWKRPAPLTPPGTQHPHPTSPPPRRGGAPGGGPSEAGCCCCARGGGGAEEERRRVKYATTSSCVCGGWCGVGGWVGGAESGGINSPPPPCPAHTSPHSAQCAGARSWPHSQRLSTRYPSPARSPPPP